MKFFKFFNLRFFDEGPTNTDDGESGGEKRVEGGEGSPDLLGKEAGKDPKEPVKPVNDDPYAEFNVKSRLLYAGRSEDEDESQTGNDGEPGNDGANGQPGSDGNSSDGGKSTEPNQPKPYKVLKYRGQEVPIMSEDDLVRLASQGLDYTQKTQQIAPYRAVIERVERNPILAQRIVEIIRQADQGTLTDFQKQPPKPEGLSRNSEPEPEQREDETWDEFMERREKWKAGNADPNAGKTETSPLTKEQIASEIEAVLAERERQARVFQLAELARQDEHHEAVVRALLTFPKSVQAEMNADEQAFQAMYDLVRSNMEVNGKKLGRYFLPIIQKMRGVPNDEAPLNSAVPAGQQQNKSAQQAVSIKGNSYAKAPFTENGRGGTKPGTPQNPQKSIWDMTTEEFRKLREDGARLE